MNLSSINNILANFLGNFILKSFVNKTKYPVISIILFIVTLVLNIIQYLHNDKYLQTYFSPSTFNYYAPRNTYSFFGNIMIYFLDVIGVNGFIKNTPAHILLLLITYTLFGLIELNIGHFAVFVFFLWITMCQYFIARFGNFVCMNETYNYGIDKSVFCCGSFIWVASLGFCMYVIQQYLQLKWRLIFILLMIIVYGLFAIYDYINSSQSLDKNKNQRICSSMFWHSSLYIFGIIFAISFSN